MKNGGIVRRTSHSLAGVATAWRRERSFRTHVAGSAVLCAALAWRGVSLDWWAVTLLAIALGWALEIVNAAIETLCDKLHPAHDAAIGAVKDLASASAFVVNLAILAVGLLAFVAGS